MLRIHFTASDLAHIRVAATPDPMWEIALSMHVLRSRLADPLLEGWKQQALHLLRSGALQGQMSLARALNPPIGYFPDFLTPADGVHGLDAGLQALLMTPKQQLRHEVSALCDAHPSAARVTHEIGAGNAKALTSFGRTLKRYFETVIAPAWTRVSAAAEADRRLRGQQLADGGPAAMLSELAPLARFRHDALELLHYRKFREIHLDGRGVTLIPSYFKETPTLMLLANPALAPVIVYPVHRTARISAEAKRTSLVALLGRSRAAVLEQAGTGTSVSDLAGRLRISQPNVSKHLAVLRDAGLLASMRDQNKTRHFLTPLGHSLLDGL